MISTKAAKPEFDPEPMEVSLTGHALMDNALLNKGSAFPETERRELNLFGLLPPHVSTMDEQLQRTYENYRQKESDIERYIFLTALQDRNETLFYRLCQEHITEMMPIIYTPVVGAGCQRYSHIYRRPRGLYVSYAHDDIETVLGNAANNEVQVIVVTDGERILGLGDLGVGGMGIPVGKLSLYTLCAGVHPATTLPIVLDVGTDNESLLGDPLYLGWRHKRVRGAEYDEFIEQFVCAVIKKFPNVLLQWEDFSKNNATRLLEAYRDRLCTFNDDIQGTGAVTLAGMLAAMEVKGEKIRDQRVVILGAGSSATGISDQLVSAMMSEGLTKQEAKEHIWLIDSHGLVHTGRLGLESFKQKYAQPLDRLDGWELKRPDHVGLFDVVRNVQPTILIGTSAQPGAFTEDVVREMAMHVEWPIIFPLSNPTSKCEAAPIDLINWTDGKAMIATGSPFPPVVFDKHIFNIGQCNNAFVFPGVGLGVIASGARRVTNEMFVAAARALAEFSPALHDPAASLYPALEGIRRVSRRVAVAVGAEAQRQNLAEQTTREELERRVDHCMWIPRYVPYRKRVETQL